MPVVLIAGVATLAVGCGGDNAGSGAATTTAAGAATSATATTTATSGGSGVASTTTAAKGATGASVAGAEPSRKLVYGVVNFGQTFDVHKTTAFGDGGFYQPLYDTLLVVGKNGDYLPSLASAWKVEATKVTFTLRSGVKFQDGTPFDATAVKANIDRAMTLPDSTAKSQLGNVVSVDAPAPDTVVFNMKAGALNLLSILASNATPGPAFMMSPASFNSDLTNSGVGTGPYKVTSVGAGRGTVDYAVWPDSWDQGGIGADSLEFVVNADGGQRLNQVTTGASNVSYTDGALADKAKASGLQLRPDQQNSGYYLGINRAGEAFASLDARRALFLGIDRAAILDGVQFGYGEVGTQFVASGFPGYNPDIKATYDADQAKQLAEQSGLTKRTVKMVVWNIPSIVSYGEAVQGQLQEIGVNVEITLSDPAKVRADWKSGQFDLAMLFNSANLQADQTPLVNRLYSAQSPENPSGPPPPELQTLIDQSAQATDVDTQASLFSQMAKVNDDQALVLFIVKQQIPTIGTADVLNFDSDTYAGIFLRGMVLGKAG